MSAGTEVLLAPGLPAPSPWRERLRELRTRRITAGAGIVFAVLVAYCAFWPLVAPYGANDVKFERSAQYPSLAHPLGTDQFGRDLLSRLAVGGQTSLMIAGLALAIILGIGVVYGTIAGVAGGALDAAMMRLVDGLFALPRFPVAVVILAVLKLYAQNVQTVAFALAILGWMLTARLVRGQVRSVTSRDYVRAAQALGAGRVHLVRRHLIPNSAGIILVALFLELPTIILGEAFLTILGLGPSPPTATWGSIARDGMDFARLWDPLLASAFIAVFTVCANILVDGIQEALDPRRRLYR